MNYLKLFIFGIIVSVGIFSSCTNNDNLIENLPDPQESATMQTTLDLLKTFYNEDGTEIDDQHPTGNLIFDFCFEFVFPINLIYNTGSTVTVNSNEELIEILINSTSELYIFGIEFPFDVMVFNPDSDIIEIITITNESEFAALFINCDFDGCGCTDEYDPVCVEIEENGMLVIITFPNECYAECEGFTEEEYFECDGCECPQVYDPVCVEFEGEIIEFENACFAECEGFTEEDFIDCPLEECEIEELEIIVGECNSDGTYPITISFEYENADSDYFDVYNDDDELIGRFMLSELPVTIPEFEGSGFEYDYLMVCIESSAGGDGTDCCEDIEWEAPNCNGSGDCDIYDLEVSLGDCNSDGTYPLTIDFEYENADNSYFDVYIRNDEFLGYFELSDLPLTIENFELSGFDYDYIKVCINDNFECCEEIEWEAPECETDTCEIYDLEVSVGDCIPGTNLYELTIDFEYEHPGNTFFDVYVRNDEFIGYYSLSDLPITIEEFEESGYDDDYIKVCINDVPDCCDEIEWESPECE